MFEISKFLEKMGTRGNRPTAEQLRLPSPAPFGPADTPRALHPRIQWAVSIFIGAASLAGAVAVLGGGYYFLAMIPCLLGAVYLFWPFIDDWRSKNPITFAHKFEGTAAAILVIFGVVLIVWHPKPEIHSTSVTAKGTGTIGVFAGRDFTQNFNFPDDKTPSEHPKDEVLPGYGNGTLLRIDSSTSGVDRTYFAAKTPENSAVWLHQGRGNQFVFSVLDVRGDAHQAEIPLGSNGIPFGKFVYLFCEVGTASSYSYIRVLVNGNEVKRLDFDFPLDLGSLKWSPSIGGGGSFSFAEMGAYATTLQDESLKAISDNALRYYRISP